MAVQPNEAGYCHVRLGLNIFTGVVQMGEGMLPEEREEMRTGFLTLNESVNKLVVDFAVFKTVCLGVNGNNGLKGSTEKNTTEIEGIKKRMTEIETEHKNKRNEKNDRYKYVKIFVAIILAVITVSASWAPVIFK